MKLWKVHLGLGIICLTVGILFFLLPFSGIVYSAYMAVSLYLLGVFIAGFGTGMLVSSLTINTLEKKTVH